MLKLNLAFSFLLLVLAGATYAGEHHSAVEIVACVNSENGFSEELQGEPWVLEQAILEVPYEHETKRLDTGYHFVAGRMLGWHGTWIAFLDLNSDEWTAFETRTQDDGWKTFGESFVPKSVIQGFAACGVNWGGLWTGEYPLNEVGAEQNLIAPSVLLPIEGGSLLPPKPIE